MGRRAPRRNVPLDLCLRLYVHRSPNGTKALRFRILCREGDGVLRLRHHADGGHFTLLGSVAKVTAGSFCPERCGCCGHHDVAGLKAMTKWLFTGLSITTFLGATLCAEGVLQAACLFTGDRATRNVEFWGTLACVMLASCIVFGVLAIRADVKAKKNAVS
jgi:hypothetical protein